MFVEFPRLREHTESNVLFDAIGWDLFKIKISAILVMVLEAVGQYERDGSDSGKQFHFQVK
jgi:hypothetical protein